MLDRDFLESLPKVKNNQPVDLTMGCFNVIWQGKANEMILRSIEHIASPALILNITGPETLHVRDVALEFGKLFNTKVQFTGDEAKTALLSNAEQAFRLFGKPKVPVQKVMEWTARWMEEEKKLLGKPTHFEGSDGKY